MTRRALALLAAALCAAAPGGPCFALEAEVTGFASVVAGRALSGSRSEPYLGLDCPCFIADYAHAGVYGPDWSTRPETRLGVQVDANLGPKVSASLQIVGRAVEGGDVAALEWAYLAYEARPGWTLFAGRRRLPMFYYSEFQDVGFAYPWVRPPQELYGWDATNYNGFGAAYRGELAGWSGRVSAFYGNEHERDSSFSRLYYYPNVIEVDWRNIVGADLELTRGPFNLRVVHIQSKVRTYDRTLQEDIYPEGRQKIYGLSANLDWRGWLVRSEYNVIDRSETSYRVDAAMVALGRRFGGATAALTWSWYEDRSDLDEAFQQQRQHNVALTLRYDLNAKSALKLQLDRFEDRSSYDFVGSSRVLSIAYDLVF